MFLKKNKKKSLVAAQEDLNSRLVSANQSLMRQMEEQQERDMARRWSSRGSNQRYYVRLWGGRFFC